MASNSQLTNQYSDIADGKPVTLSMAIDGIESLQKRLVDVERKVPSSWLAFCVNPSYEVFKYTISWLLGCFGPLLPSLRFSLYSSNYFPKRALLSGFFLDMSA